MNHSRPCCRTSDPDLSKDECTDCQVRPSTLLSSSTLDLYPSEECLEIETHQRRRTTDMYRPEECITESRGFCAKGFPSPLPIFEIKKNTESEYSARRRKGSVKVNTSVGVSE